MKSIHTLYPLLAFGLLSLTLPANAVDKTFVSGSWSAAGGWDPTGVPTASDDVIRSLSASDTNAELFSGAYEANSIALTSSGDNPTVASLNVRARSTGDKALTILTSVTYNVSGKALNFFRDPDALANDYSLTIGSEATSGTVHVQAGEINFGNFRLDRTLTSFTLAGPAPTTTVDSGATLRFTIMNQAITASSYGVGALTNNGTVYLNGRINGLTSEVTASSLSGSGQLRASYDSSSDAAHLTVDQSSDTTYSGTLLNGDGGALAVTKAGVGSLELSGVNTYTGGTTVSAGTLLVTNASGSGLGSGAVAVEGGTLGGDGSIALGGNAFTVASGASLLAGTGTATGDLSLNAATSFADGSQLIFALGGSGTHSSLVRAGGSWTFDSDQAILFLNDGAELGFYDDFIAGLASDPGVAGWTIANSGWEGTFSYAGGNVDFTLTSIPEPSTWTLSLAGLSGLLYLASRKRKRKNA